MRHKVVIFDLLIIIVFTLTGCWDAVDINKKDLVTTVIIGKSGEDYTFHLEIGNSSAVGSREDGEAEPKNFIVVDSSGETLADTREDLELKLCKPLYLGTVYILVVTRDLVKEGIGEYMYRLRNMKEYRKALNLVITSEDPNELLEINSGREASVGLIMENTLAKLKEKGQCIENCVSVIFEKLSSQYVCFLIPNINLSDDAVDLTGYTIIHDSHYNGEISIKDTKGLTYIMNKKVQWMYVVPFGENYATVEVKLKKKSIKPFLENGEISFNANFEFESIVKYLNINDGLTKDLEEEVKKNLHDMILYDIKLAIEQSQNEFRCDYLGFYEVFRISYPNEFKEMDWSNEYLDSDINIAVNVKLDPGGEFDYNPISIDER